MASPPPPIPTVIKKGFGHFTHQISITLPTDLRKTHVIRRFAVSKLGKGRS